MDRFEHAAFVEEKSLQFLNEIVEDVEVVSYLHSSRGSLERGFSVQATAVTGDDFNPRMGSQPRCDALGLLIRGQVHWLFSF